MGTTLSKGYFKPSVADTGDVWFPAMANNIQLLNDHTHNGTDAALLAVTTQTISHTNWGVLTLGAYSQTITVPTGFNYDSCQIEFRLSSGERIYPSVTRLSSTTYSIATIDNTLDYTAVYR